MGRLAIRSQYAKRKRSQDQRNYSGRELLASAASEQTKTGKTDRVSGVSGAGEKLFVLYDGRAKYDGTDRATVLVSARSQKEALADSLSWRGYDAVWYEYDVVNKQLTNEKMRADLGKGILG